MNQRTHHHDEHQGYPESVVADTSRTGGVHLAGRCPIRDEDRCGGNFGGEHDDVAGEIRFDQQPYVGHLLVPCVASAQVGSDSTIPLTEQPRHGETHLGSGESPSEGKLATGDRELGDHLPERLHDRIEQRRHEEVC